MGYVSAMIIRWITNNIHNSNYLHNRYNRYNTWNIGNHGHHMLHICIICIPIVLPYRPQVRHAHQTGSCRLEIQEDPELQDRQAEDVQLHAGRQRRSWRRRSRRGCWWCASSMRHIFVINWIMLITRLILVIRHKCRKRRDILCEGINMYKCYKWYNTNNWYNLHE